MVDVDYDLELKKKLKDVFGYDSFRGLQEDIIKNILAGNNTFVLMPTGAGKSLCYQLPAITIDGTAIVISPLIALMKNQVDSLNAVGVNAHFLNSTLSKAEATRVKNDVLTGDCKLLYIAPESLTKEDNLTFLKNANISFVAIDEAHCISEWGHDFRPEYRRIKSIIQLIGDLPVIALTATATPKVQQDIQRNLGMEGANVFKSSFNRTNLYYEVRPKNDTKRELIKFVKENKGKSGIIYCLSRKKVEEIAEFLQVNDVKAIPYHAGLDPHVRMKNQDAFLNEDVEVVVATIAFGMGIDKPDIRFVIHYDTPKSLEGYYQETGRAGRDGLEGKCVMFYSYDDIIKLEKFQKDKTVTERDNARNLLFEMSSYAESTVCRRTQLLHYFGETYGSKACSEHKLCDNCKFDREQYQAQVQIETVLKTVIATNERFKIDHLADIIYGNNSEYVQSYEHYKLDVFGIGKAESDAFWRSVIRQSMFHGLLEKDYDNVGIIKITTAGKEYIENPYPIKLNKDIDFSSTEPCDDDTMQSGHDETLYNILKGLRKQVANKKGLPPYVIFQENSLLEMATVYPTTLDALSHINGVGTGKVQKFGAPFIEAITKYIEENDITPPIDVQVKSSVNRSKIKIFIIQQVDRQIYLDEIAESKKISMNKLLEEVEHIVHSGTKLNIDYYIEDTMDDEKIDEIYNYFMEAETEDIEDAVAEFEEYATEEEIRLVKIKFMSEVAN